MDNNELLTQIAAMMEQQSSQLKLYIENHVEKKIQALTDGYKLTHEKQWELERETEALKAKTDELQARIVALESKIA